MPTSTTTVASLTPGEYLLIGLVLGGGVAVVATLIGTWRAAQRDHRTRLQAARAEHREQLRMVQAHHRAELERIRHSSLQPRPPLRVVPGEGSLSLLARIRAAEDMNVRRLGGAS